MKSDWSLVSFTVLAQAAVGACWGLAASWVLIAARAGREIAGAATAWGLAAVPVVAALALALSLFHLGRSGRAWRAVANLRRSWLAREVLAAAGFFLASCLVVVVPGSRRAPLLALAVAGGAGLVVAMVGTYRMRTVPAWDRWTTGAFFVQSVVALGGVTTAFLLALTTPHAGAGPAQSAAAVIGGSALLAGGPLVKLWRRGLLRDGGAAADSAERLDRERLSVLLRTVLAAGAAGLLVAALALPAPWRVAVLAAAVTLGFAAEVLGRVLFYRVRVRAGL